MKFYVYHIIKYKKSFALEQTVIRYMQSSVSPCLRGGKGLKFFDTEEADKSYDLHGLMPRIKSAFIIAFNPCASVARSKVF
jgi:hypothetical protein